MRSTEMDVFVREGLRRYASACEAIQVFEGEIHARILRHIREKRDWVNFVPTRGDEIGATAKGEDWLSAYLYAADGSGNVDLGLWWRTPRAPDGVIAYCCFYEGKSQVSLELDSPRAPVKCGGINNKRKRLYVVLDGSEDLDEVLDVLLSEIDRALRPRGSA